MLPSNLERFSTTAGGALVGEVDLERMLVDLPRYFTTKGMFFSRYVAALGAEWEEVLPSLEEPAKHGRYHAFESYPMRDYMRVFGRVAGARFPGSTREAFRLLARGEVEVFASSTLGRVAFSLLREPGGALLRYPDLFGAIVRGPELLAKRIDKRRVTVTNSKSFGSVEQGLGILEGIVQSFDEEPRVEVTRETERKVTFDVSW